VDDNTTNLQVLHEILGGRGYRLLIAKNGETALSIAHKAKPSLILLDIMMPGMDGYEVCRRLKADPETQDIPVIFLSALDDTKDKVKGLDLGAVDYVSKPFQAEEVIALVNTHLTT
ncbi:MAG: response regulator, partial [candidate division Zixibacteria bacterium]|nr:response regulator [candidate division Zixibacteria bacterium]